MSIENDHNLSQGNHYSGNGPGEPFDLGELRRSNRRDIEHEHSGWEVLAGAAIYVAVLLALGWLADNAPETYPREEYDNIGLLDPW